MPALNELIDAIARKQRPAAPYLAGGSVRFDGERFRTTSPDFAKCDAEHEAPGRRDRRAEPF